MKDWGRVQQRLCSWPLCQRDWQWPPPSMVLEAQCQSCQPPHCLPLQGN